MDVVQDTPSARLARLGPEALTDGELMQLGLKMQPARVSDIITKYGSAAGLMGASHAGLAQHLGSVKGSAVVALRELLRRASLPKQQPEAGGPRQVYELLSDLRDKKKEHFVALYVNARNRVLHRELVSIGTLTASLVHPREVFGPALAMSAAGVIVAHNHPSGDQNPSAEDRAATRRLERAGRILGVPLLDHVIVAENGFYSFRENGGLSA